MVDISVKTRYSSPTPKQVSSHFAIFYFAVSRFLGKKVKGKDVDLYSAFHAPGTPNAHTSLKLTRQTAI